MADIKIEIRGLNELNTYLTNLPSKLNKNFETVTLDFSRFIQKSAKLRAPQGPTGNLKDSIHVTIGNKKEVVVSVDNPYAYFQENGFRPHMIYPNMDNRLGIKLKDLGIDHPIFVSQHKAFVTPAVEMALAKLPNMISKAADKALQ